MGNQQTTANTPKPVATPVTNNVSSGDIGEFKNYIGKSFCILSRANKKFCIDTGGNQNGGGSIKIWEKQEDMHANQTWTVDDLGRLISWQNRNSILQLPASTDGTKPIIVGISGNARANDNDHRWKLDNGAIRSLVNNTFVLDVEGGNMANGTPVIKWTDGGGANQRWDILLVSDASNVKADMNTVTKSTDTSASNKISIPITVDPAHLNIPDNKGVHSLYNTLQATFDSNDRKFSNSERPTLEINYGSNKNNNGQYNAAGNIKLRAVMPNQDKYYPNFVSEIIAMEDDRTPSSDLVRILTTFITDPNLLATYYISERLKEVNGVPPQDLKTKLSEPNYCWNWNAGRNFSNTDSMKSAINYYVHKLNQLINHVITNDLVSPDKTFNELLMGLFANDSGLIYPIANGTLVLPSLINWIGDKCNGSIHAMSNCAYYGTNKKLFKADEGSNWSALVKWSDDDKAKDNELNPCIVAAYKVDPTTTNESSANYAFSNEAQNVNVAPLPSSPLDYLTGQISMKFEKDNYTNTAHLEALKQLKFATRDKGSFASEPISNPGKDTIEITVDFNITDLANPSNFTFTYAHDCPYSSRKACGETRANTTCYPKQKTVTLYTMKQRELINKLHNEATIKPLIIAQYKKVNLSDPRCTIGNISITGPVLPNYCDGNKKLISNEFANDREHDKYDSPHEVSTCFGFLGCTCKNTIHEDKDRDLGRIVDRHNLLAINTKAPIQAKYTVSFTWDIKDSVTRFTGSNGCAIGQSSTDAAAKANSKALVWWNTTMPLYQFNKHTFNSWTQILRNSNVQKVILKYLREYLISHPTLILMNKMFENMFSLVKQYTVSAAFVGLPIGPPVMTVPDSKVVPHKYYIPEMSFNTKFDESLAKYNADTIASTVINTMSCVKKTNYLDSLLSSMIEQCVAKAVCKDPGYELTNVAIMIMLPGKGYQLFDMISDTMISTLSGKMITVWADINDAQSEVYNYKMPKILITFRDLSVDANLKLMGSHYQFMTSLNVPVMKFIRNGGWTEVMINTMSNDPKNHNRAYVYVSKDDSQELVSALKGSGASDIKDKNVDKNSKINTMIVVQYNGIESRDTPKCLQLVNL